MKPYYDVIIMIPVGPGTQLSFLRDTIDSCIHYTKSSYKIVVADNSREGIGEALLPFYQDLDIMLTEKATGSMGGLYITLSHLFLYMLRTYDFKLIMKLDTDALLIGTAPENTALPFFASHPRMAMAGQYPLDYHGNPWDFAWPCARIINGTMTWKFIRRPRANFALRQIYLDALRHNYKAGESVFGGAYYLSREFLEELQSRHLLPKAILSTVRLSEDHLFSLLAKSVGMELGDLSGQIPIFACAWKGLPASPHQLWHEGKKIIHSTRGWDGMNEQDIRDYYRERRRYETTLLPEKEMAD